MSKPSAEIPVIDISPSNSHAATQLLDAATEHGFVFIENNAVAGMPPANVESMFDLVSLSAFRNRKKNTDDKEQSKQFFQGSIENKQECPAQNNRGWVSMQQETLDPGNQKVKL
jgi:isopenicillin N synthase-like dioxygenase